MENLKNYIDQVIGEEKARLADYVVEYTEAVADAFDEGYAYWGRDEFIQWKKDAAASYYRSKNKDKAAARRAAKRYINKTL